MGSDDGTKRRLSVLRLALARPRRRRAAAAAALLLLLLLAGGGRRRRRAGTVLELDRSGRWRVAGRRPEDRPEAAALRLHPEARAVLEEDLLLEASLAEHRLAEGGAAGAAAAQAREHRRRRKKHLPASFRGDLSSYVEVGDDGGAGAGGEAWDFEIVEGGAEALRHAEDADGERGPAAGAGDGEAAAAEEAEVLPARTSTERAEIDVSAALRATDPAQRGTPTAAPPAAAAEERRGAPAADEAAGASTWRAAVDEDSWGAADVEKEIYDSLVADREQRRRKKRGKRNRAAIAPEAGAGANFPVQLALAKEAAAGEGAGAEEASGPVDGNATTSSGGNATAFPTEVGGNAEDAGSRSPPLLPPAARAPPLGENGTPPSGAASAGPARNDTVAANVTAMNATANRTAAASNAAGAVPPAGPPPPLRFTESGANVADLASPPPLREVRHRHGRSRHRPPPPDPEAVKTDLASMTREERDAYHIAAARRRERIQAARAAGSFEYIAR